MRKKITSKVYLYIDSVSSHDLVLGLLHQSGEIIERRLIKNGVRTEKFLVELVKFINKQSKKLVGIIVVQGSGSFSQARLVCALANSIAYAWNIKIATVNLLSLKQTSLKINTLSWQKLLRPKYRGPGVG